MENKTALQQLKENWEQKQKELIEAFEDDKIVDVHFTAANKAISAFLKDIERLLPVEREQIEMAYREGGWRGYEGAGDYFTSNYPFEY